jgi:hypothetical protein
MDKRVEEIGKLECGNRARRYHVTRLYVLDSGRTLVLGVISPPIYVIRFRTHSTEQWS